MPLLNISESKKVTALVTIEETTARKIEQYAAMTKGSPDEVVQQALDYVFSKDKDFESFARDHAAAKPKIALRLKKATIAAASSEATARDTSTVLKAAR